MLWYGRVDDASNSASILEDRQIPTPSVGAAVAATEAQGPPRETGGTDYTQDRFWQQADISVGVGST
jgi:hypothetical protein